MQTVTAEVIEAFVHSAGEAAHRQRWADCLPQLSELGLARVRECRRLADRLTTMFDEHFGLSPFDPDLLQGPLCRIALRPADQIDGMMMKGAAIWHGNDVRMCVASSELGALLRAIGRDAWHLALRETALAQPPPQRERPPSGAELGMAIQATARILRSFWLGELPAPVRARAELRWPAGELVQLPASHPDEPAQAILLRLTELEDESLG